jgi:hypothetical protein
MTGAAASGALALLPVPVLAAAGNEAADSVVLLWNQAVLQGVRESKLGPPMTARALAIVHACAYDAWAAYDPVAVGTRLGGSLRRPRAERTGDNKSKAISFAAYRAAVDLFPASRTTVFDPLMQSLGHDPDDTGTGASSASGVGNLAAQAVLAFRHHDGANQLGDEPGGAAGVPYSDYTGFRPANDPMDVESFDRASVHDPNLWQPLHYTGADGKPVTQPFLGAHWSRVRPFALTSASAMRPPIPPARFGSFPYLQQARAVLELTAGLTDEQKMIAEYWADGPRSELPPGHWNLFAQYVARRDRPRSAERAIDRDVRLFFTLTNAGLDASICCWDNKRAFASVRPITAIRYLFEGRRLLTWGGPSGVQWIDGKDWRPYQPSTFPTPPFPEFSSGHSTFSAAAAQVLMLFTRSDRFGASVSFPAGSSRIEPGIVPAGEVKLRWDTFSQAADQAGLSRRYGGIHFEYGDLAGRATGRLVGLKAWVKALGYFGGRAPS